MAAVRLTNVAKQFGGLRVLEAISFTIAGGEIAAVVGPSGCGKTTLLRMISGELQPTDGEVLFGESLPKRHAIVPQRDLLFPWYSLLENVLIGGQLSRSGYGRAEAVALLSALGLDGFASAYPSQVSGGMRQRGALARALMANPALLLVDESFSQIDFALKLALEAALRQWVRRKRSTAIVVSHDVESAIALADRVIVLSRRPAVIVDNIPINLPDRDNGSLAARADKQFSMYLNRVIAALGGATFTASQVELV